jgi:hypothetical protein
MKEYNVHLIDRTFDKETPILHCTRTIKSIAIKEAKRICNATYPHVEVSAYDTKTGETTEIVYYDLNRNGSINTTNWEE